MPLLYRLLREKYRHDPLSVVGSRLAGGRWNPRGVGVLYTTTSPELALVEALVHAPSVRYEELPAWWLVTLRAEEDIRYFERGQMPDYWQNPTYERTQTWLADWLAAPDTLGVGVPSVVVPLSANVILHPAHPLFARIEVLHGEPLPVDRRLWRLPPDSPA